MKNMARHILTILKHDISYLFMKQRSQPNAIHKH